MPRSVTIHVGPPVGGGGITAQSADALVESIGVNVHLGFTNGVYDTDYEARVRDRLVEAGIRHIRDHAYDDKGETHRFYSRLAELAGLGISCSGITTMAGKSGDPPATNFSLLDDVYTWTSGAFDQFEGTNEPDIQAMQGGQDWAANSRAAQQTLWETVQATPAMVAAGVKVVAPSVTWPANCQQHGDVSMWCDYGNWHPYAGAARPSLVNGSTPRADHDDNYHTFVSGGKPLQTTEFGYHNNVPQASGHYGTSELATAIYTPVMYLGYFRDGYYRQYEYELLNQGTTGQEDNFGLIRFDGTAKPAFTAVKNLITLLADPGGAFTLPNLDYTLSGTPVDDLLLAQRDGSRWLCLWRDVSVWNRDTQTDITVTPADAIVTFNAPVASVTAYTPRTGVSGSAVTLSGTPQTATVPLAGDAVLLKVVV